MNQYSEVDHKDGRAPASNILQTSNRILSGIDRSEGGLSRYSKDFGDLSSVTQQNVVYHQSRIYFNMLEKRKESNEICLLLTQPHALRPEVPVVISHSARMKPEALKKSGSSHPNNSTNTHLYNATFSESCKESAHQPVSKRNNPSGYSAALRSDDKVQQSYVCSKKA